MNQSNTPENDSTLRRTRLDLGYGTIVRIAGIGAIAEYARGGGTAPIEYEFEKRGRLSLGRIRKTLERLVNNSLTLAISQQDQSAYWQRKAARSAHWNHKHIVAMPNMQSTRSGE